MQFFIISTASSAYGEQHQGQRPLSTSFLHERDTPVAVNTDNDEAANNDQAQSRNTNNANNESNRNDANKTIDNETDGTAGDGHADGKHVHDDASQQWTVCGSST